MVKWCVPVSLLLLSLPFWLSGQNESIVFKHISVEQGLSQGHAGCLLKDSDGFLWIGTQDGLNRYDGYEFRHFYHRTDDTASLSNNYIWCLLEDSRRNIWIGTFGGGLCRFDRKTETFQTFHPVPPSQATVAENSVRSLSEFPGGTLWVGCDNGLWKFDISTSAFQQLGADYKNLRLVTALHPMGEEYLLIGEANGLFQLDLNDGSMLQHSIFGAVTAIAAESDRHFWAGSGKGLYLLEYLSERDSLLSRRHYFHHPENPFSLLDNNVNCLYFEKNAGVLWVGANSGLSRLETGRMGKGFQNFTHRANLPNSLSTNMVFSIMEAGPGLMWAGTREGVNVFSNQPPKFFTLRFDDSGKGLCANSVLGMTEDDRDNLWVATKGGLTRIGHFSKAPTFWEMECLTTANTPSMPHDYVLDVINLEKDGLWVMFRRNGFARLRSGSGGRWFFEKQDLHEILNGAGMNALLLDRQGRYWLGTPGLGLLEWHPEKGVQKVFFAGEQKPNSLLHPYVFCLLEDSLNRFWVGTANGGLCRLNRDEGVFTCYVHDDNDTASLSSNMALSLFEDSRRRLWICTANGLNLMENEGRFRRFLQKDGLPNEVIYGMLEDDNGNLWVSTNRGLSKITFRDGNFTTQNFSAAGGLQGNEFNQYAFYKTKDGRLCFGGPNGLTLFDPSAIQPYPHAPPVVLTDFQLFNRSVPIGEKGGNAFFLKNSVNETEEIILRHSQNFIAFEFAALGYMQPENNSYAYKLEGLDENWVQSGNRRFASYPNLPPGSYTFLVKAANHDGVWNETPKTIRIRVLPPWWLTWWAYFLYVVAVAVAVLAFARQREASVRRLERAKAEERESFRKRTARDFHDEAGNKITKIALLTEVAKRQSSGDSVLTSLLSQVEENVQELRSGMRDFIWVLDPENDNLYDTLLRLKDFGNSLFAYAAIRFTTKGLDDSLHDLRLNGNQRRHLLLIIKEAMNNCLKYSEAGEAKLAVSRQGGSVELSFSDNGKGFDLKTTQKGNGLKNMQARAEKAGGVLTIQSKQGEGTGIFLKFAG